MSIRWCLLATISFLLAVWVKYYAFPQSDESARHDNRFGSFAPVRIGCRARWFVDGKDYMSAVADAIQAASYEIFIAGFQLNPHIFMKRPETGVDKLDWRLDRMLLEKAKTVKVYILLYSESEKIADMHLGSEFTETVLKHKNISVLLHPDVLTVVNHPIKGTGWWTHHEKVVVVDRSIAFVGGIDLCFGRWDRHDHDLTDNYPLHPCVQENEQCEDFAEEATTRYRRWVGQDYGNTFLGGSRTEFENPMKDYIDRGHVPRMPWHDVACSFTGLPARDVAQHFIQRYNSIIQRYISVDPLWRFWDRYGLYIEDKGSFSLDHLILDPTSTNLKIQVLRSVDKWSAGQPHEASIYSAYLNAIDKAEHFIYIENQFFISSQQGTFLKVHNQIIAALADRIVRAFQTKEDFHVMVVMPLKPEFPGEWCTDEAKDLEDVSYWNYLSIYSGEDSLYNRLIKKGISSNDILRYFSVYGLRTHGILDEQLVTEIIYVHSKIMIVDDRKTIIGSANINDRSMLGSRDSEVAVMIEDVDMIEGQMNGHPYQVGKFSHSLRSHLLKEHLGLLNEKNNEASTLEVEDPLTDTFREAIFVLAMENTHIYELMFQGEVEVANEIQDCETFMHWRSEIGFARSKPELAKKELEKVRGRIVVFSVHFLQAHLGPSYWNIGGLRVDASELSETDTAFA